MIPLGKTRSEEDIANDVIRMRLEAQVQEMARLILKIVRGLSAEGLDVRIIIGEGTYIKVIDTLKDEGVMT